MSVSILSVSKYRLSYMSGFDSALVTFESSLDMTAWRIMKDGSSYDTGTLLEELTKDWSNLSDETWGAQSTKSWNELLKLDAGVDVTVQIYASELDLGSNTINVYAKGTNGVWSLREG